MGANPKTIPKEGETGRQKIAGELERLNEDVNARVALDQLQARTQLRELKATTEGEMKKFGICTDTTSSHNC